MVDPDNVERIFLLEILVDNVFINTSELNLDPKTISSMKQTCVRFQFLNYPAIEICEEDFAPKGDGGYDEDNIPFKSGKSCLFAVRGQRPPAFKPPFNMNVSVCKILGNKKPCTIGTTCIKLGESFATIVNCCVVCPESPTSKTVQETYPILDDRNCEIGKITVFIRLSCFGKQIITQFQLGGLENKSFLFKADSETIKKDDDQPKEPKIMYPSADKEPIAKPETICQEIGGSQPPPRLPTGPCGPQRGMGGMGMPGMGMPGMGMPGMGMPCMGMPGMGMPGMGMMGAPPMMMGGGGGGAMPSMSLMPLLGGGEPEQKKESSEYKDITASLNGHELFIKILRKPRLPKPRSPTSSQESLERRIQQTLAMEKVKKSFCECQVPFPKEVIDIQCKEYRTDENAEGNCPKNSSVKGGSKVSGNQPNQPPAPVKVKENYILRLGECPPLCYKIPCHKPPPKPCTTVRDSQFEQADNELAMQLYEKFLAEQAKAAGKGKGKGKGKKK